MNIRFLPIIAALVITFGLLVSTAAATTVGGQYPDMIAIG